MSFYTQARWEQPPLATGKRETKQSAKANSLCHFEHQAVKQGVE